MAGSAPFARIFLSLRELMGSHQVFSHDRVLLAGGKSFGLCNDEIFTNLKPIRMAIWTNIHFRSDNRVTTHTDFIQSRIFDDTTSAFCAVS